MKVVVGRGWGGLEDTEGGAKWELQPEKNS